MRAPERSGDPDLRGGRPPPAGALSTAGCQGLHAWAPVFCEDGRLGCWRCAHCALKDREVDPHHRLASQGKATEPSARPPVPGRVWGLSDGSTLLEGEPTGMDFVGEPIPGLTDAHSFTLRDAGGQLVGVYEPRRVQLQAFADHYRLVRFQVRGDVLEEFDCYCFEDSTFEIPNVKEPDRRVVLEGLRPLP